SHPYQTVPYDIVKSSQAIFLAELLYKVLKEEESRPELFHFLNNSFQILDLLQSGVANFHLIFLIQLARYMGFAPTNNYNENQQFFDMASGNFTGTMPLHQSFLEPGESMFFKEFMDIPYEEAGKIKLSAAVRNRLLQRMVEYFSLHLGIRLQIKSLEILGELFS
ncbi:MAG TPA: DNA repair protein RecO C-terminal domain-containing protein, partial [Prolixibacteraceae bacterium]|nr:DNA repair protein RecO C-terminal domain-containing protein [Prolixibacteraceae bacterium]